MFLRYVNLFDLSLRLGGVAQTNGFPVYDLCARSGFTSVRDERNTCCLWFANIRVKTHIPGLMT